MSIRDEAIREAELRWPSYPIIGFSGAGDRQAAFVSGAEWQASREATDAEVEAAAKALFSEIFRPVPDVTWGSVSEDVRDNYRVKVRVTLRAARGQG